MDYDLDYLYYFLGGCVYEGSLSITQADSIYSDAVVSGILPDLKYLPYSE